jgi:hypothetical protein
MSLSNATENQILKSQLQGIDPAYRADPTQYAALVSLQNPDEAAPIAAELTYTGYARIPITKATAWTDNGSSFNNAVQFLFGKRTDAGATQQAKAMVIVDTASGPISQGIIAALADTLDINLNIQPIFAPNDVTISCE